MKCKKHIHSLIKQTGIKKCKQRWITNDKLEREWKKNVYEQKCYDSENVVEDQNEMLSYSWILD